MSSVVKMQTPASHAGYAFGPVKETYITACCPVTKVCQTYGWGTSGFGPDACGRGVAVEEEGRGLHGGGDWNAGSLVHSLLPHTGRKGRVSRLMPSDVLNLAFRGDTPLLCFAYDSATMPILMSMASLKPLFLRQL